jgi:hypothetical protein
MACLVGDELRLKERDMGISVSLLLAAGGAGGFGGRQTTASRDRVVEHPDA